MRAGDRRGIRRALFCERRNEEDMCYLGIAGCILLILLICSFHQNYTIITILSLAVSLSSVVSTIIVKCMSKSNRLKKNICCRAERDQLKFLIPVITGAGVLSALTSMTIAEKTVTVKLTTETISCTIPNTILDKCEVLIFCVALLIAAGVVGRYYRELCEKIYEDEETQENAKEKLLQSLEEHLTILCSQKADSLKSDTPIISNPSPLTTKGGKRYTLCVEDLLPK